MTNQKHTVSTDALDTLGTCPIPENSGRDAIHLAVEPTVCGPQALYAAQRIKIENGVAVPATSMNWEDATGIVDPFLLGYVRNGEKFWFVVLPRTITSLRHVWSHPSFPEAQSVADADAHYVWGERIDNRPSVPAIEPEASMAKAWMKNFCEEIGERYDYIMNGAKRYLETGSYTSGEKDSGNLEGTDVPSEFWDKYRAITKEDVTEAVEKGGHFFSCSC